MNAGVNTCEVKQHNHTSDCDDDNEDEVCRIGKLRVNPNDSSDCYTGDDDCKYTHCTISGSSFSITIGLSNSF